ncbi:MAG: tetratricopeptide repeat protein, partial [Planctomycetota bacterium]|nr:tetratricopeptide repeat protein [Planctomycetota bacterium]
VYEMFVRDALLGPTPPKPPEAAWLERAAWTLRAGESDEAVVEASLDVVALPGRIARHVKLLPTAVAWRDVAIDGKAAELRRADDGWFWLDNSQPGRYRVTAKATLKVDRRGDQRRLAWPTTPAAWTTAAAESDAAWDVRFSRASASIIGGEKGTHGAVGLVPGDRLEVTWQKPQPPVHRAAQIETHAQVGWTLAEGVHQVRAVVDLRLWGGEVQELTVNLPQGADRVSITGPDVREVQPAGSAAHVFLRGPVTQRTRLSISYEAPRAKTGRMALPAFSVEGASARGGTLAIGGGAGAVLLEIDSAGLVPMALHDLPDTVRGLLAAPAVYAYQAGAGAWSAQVDVVDMAEFPVRETLVDSALYTVLYRPDGHIMTKVTYEVRNRGQQYMKVDLPPGSQLLLARVAEQQKNMARGPGDTVFVPLEKSVLTTAGLVSFPVELVYETKGMALERAGRLRLPLPRTDLPVAYARCAVSVPEGLKVRQWQGLLREVPTWSNEAGEVEFEYGQGHLAAGLKAPEPKAPPKPEKTPQAKPESKPAGTEKPQLQKVPQLGNLFFSQNQVAPAAQEPLQTPAEDTQKMIEDEGRDRHALMIQGKNYYRAGNDYYNRGDYKRAQELFNKVVEVAPTSTEAENAKKFL